jgi:hypothetical protein
MPPAGVTRMLTLLKLPRRADVRGLARNLTLTPSYYARMLNA